MNAPVPQNVLRPLGVGEMLDRAVTLCVRNFGVLALINVVVIVPTAIVGFQGQQNVQLLMQALLASLKTSGSGANAFKALSHAPQAGPWIIVAGTVIGLVGLLTTGALVDAVSRAYLSQPVSFAQSYRIALGRWWQILGMVLLYGFGFIAVYLAVVVALIAIILAVGVLYAVQHVLAIVIGVVAALAFSMVFLVSFALVALAWQVSLASVVIEGASFAAAFVRGFGLVLGRRGLRRSLLVAFAYVAVIIGIALVDIAGAGILAGTIKNAYFGVIFSAALRIVTAAFTTAFTVIFYYDVRVRQEGLDLTMSA